MARQILTWTHTHLDKDRNTHAEKQKGTKLYLAHNDRQCEKGAEQREFSKRHTGISANIVIYQNLIKKTTKPSMYFYDGYFKKQRILQLQRYYYELIKVVSN